MADVIIRCEDCKKVLAEAKMEDFASIGQIRRTKEAMTSTHRANGDCKK